MTDAPLPPEPPSRMTTGCAEAENPDSLGDLAGDLAPLVFGRANLPPWVIAAGEFQDHPRVLRIVGVRHENRALFSLLDTIASHDERAQLFDEYMVRKFCLDEWKIETAGGRRSLRNSYLRFLRGWGVDSNSIEGAVLKGWVESRLGIAPRYHKGRVEPREASYLIFARDRMAGQARTNAVDAQLDLLFEFCQYELRRSRTGRLVLYRGIQDPEEERVLARRGASERLVRLNNLCSFTSDRERAWEFGSRVLRVDVPAQRIFYFAGLVPRSILRGEDEHLVLGGECWATELRM